VAFALMNVQAPHLALVVDEAWSGLNVLFGAGLLVCLVVGVLCAFESATRFVGLFTIAAVLVLNPVTFALTLGFFGLA